MTGRADVEQTTRPGRHRLHAIKMTCKLRRTLLWDWSGYHARRLRHHNALAETIDIYSARVIGH